MLARIKRSSLACEIAVLLLALLTAALATLPALAQDAPPQPPAGSVSGMGDINLYPKRVVLDRRERTASVGLYNRALDPGEYEISIIDMVMTPEGNVYRLDNLPPGVSTDRVKVASDFLRWSPRRVRLLGSEAQTVRIMARPSADLPEGEYRSHFLVVSVPEDVDQGFSIGDAVNAEGDDGTDIGVVIRPRFGISIPVIVRVGETTLDVTLSDLALVATPQGPALSLTINRSGTRSAFGDIVVTAPGIAEPVAIARGIGVYPEIDARSFVLALNGDFDPAQLRSGMTLTVTYTDDDYEPGATLASSSLRVP